MAPLLVALAGGCGGGAGSDAAASESGPSPACSPAPTGVPTLALGTGNLSWTGLTDGTAIPLFAGTQGGYHTYASVRSTSLACSGVMIHASAYEADGTTVLGDVTYTGVDLDPVDGTRAEYLGVAVIFAPWNGVPFAQAMADLDGRPLLLEATVTDVSGRSATSSVTLIGDCCM